MTDTIVTLHSKTEDRLRPLLTDVESLAASGDGPEPRVSVLVPTYHDDPTPLVHALATSENAGFFELIIYDDGSCDSLLSEKIKSAVRVFPGPYMYIPSQENRGRSFVRNRLRELASTNWFVYLDADMLPDDPNFLNRYLATIQDDPEPRLVVGGYTVKSTKRTRSNALHYSQSRAADTPTLEQRNAAPGRYVFTGNLMVHRDVLQAVDFDPRFTGWGWEDTDWGIGVQKRFPIQHIENTASHLGLCSNASLVKRFETSGANYRLLQSKHSEVADLPLSRAMGVATKLPLSGAIKATCRILAEDRIGVVPMPLRRFCLKLLRAVAYASEDAYADTPGPQQPTS